MIDNEGLTPKKIEETANLFKQSRVLLTAVELGIFTVLHRKRLSSEEIAKEIGASVKGTDRLLNVLTGMGYLIKRNDKFINHPDITDYLVKGSLNYLGNLDHTATLWDRWSSLTEAVITGTAVDKRVINERGNEWLESFIAAMHHRGSIQAKVVSKIINLSNVKRMLDVGGGSGAFSMGFVNQNKAIKAVLFDLPNVIPLSKKYVENEGLTDKFSFIAGDYLIDDLGKDYDLIFLSAIIHINSYEENANLIKKCFNALNIGGQIVIMDFIMDEDRINPISGAMFALNMLVSTSNGDTYTKNEVTNWLNDAGFKNIDLIKTSFNSDIIVGNKYND
jgi:2-polyprenyl-3-methyl-5-hydroxy-6-metoxy-1,4-benzoquinol methylase